MKGKAKTPADSSATADGADNVGIICGGTSLIESIQRSPTKEEECGGGGGGKLAAEAVGANAGAMSVNTDGLVPAGADTTSPGVIAAGNVPPPVPEVMAAPPPQPVSSLASSKKLVTKRTLLYPMQGVTAHENNDGMQASGNVGGEEEKSPAAIVGFDTLQMRNVSLAKGLKADQSLNDLMGNVMIEVISQNGQDTAESLEEAVRNFNRGGAPGGAGGGGGVGGGAKRKGGGKQPGGGGKKNMPAGGASANLMNLLGVKQGGGDLAGNGGLNITDMLKGAKRAKGKGGGGAANWQQEQLLQTEASAGHPHHQQQQAGPPAGRGGTRGNKAKMKQFLKQTDGGKAVNYASSAVFNAPDASEIPLPDFAADMASATFAKGGFFDTA